MQSRVTRVARGWIAGSFATGVAAVAHGLVDGSAPSALAIVVGLVFAGLLGTLAIGRRPSLFGLAVVVAGSQLAFHVVFLSLTPGTAIPVGHHGAATHVTPDLLTPDLLTPDLLTPDLLTPGAVATVTAHHGTDPWMWAAHAIALLATIVFLRYAELALWNLLRDALRATVVVTVAIAARPSSDRTIMPEAPRHPISFVFRSVLSHRGPPATRFAL